MWGFLSNKVFGGGYIKRFPINSDKLVYAIGDVHGRLDLLEPLLEKILRDALQRSDFDAEPAEVVFVGDLIDRGPDTRGVLEFLTAIDDWAELKPIYLLGNHEAMLISFLDDPVGNKRWLRYGGYETLMSYEMQGLGDLTEDDNLHLVAQSLRQAMGPHLELFTQMVTSHQNGNLLFTHAGADPDVEPRDQADEAMVWGTDTFERRPRKDGIWVVHGHTVVPEPMVNDSRISIDTGAYISGALTALRVDGQQVSFLRESGEPA